MVSTVFSGIHIRSQFTTPNDHIYVHALWQFFAINLGWFAASASREWVLYGIVNTL